MTNEILKINGNKTDLDAQWRARLMDIAAKMLPNAWILSERARNAKCAFDRSVPNFAWEAWELLKDTRDRMLAGTFRAVPRDISGDELLARILGLRNGVEL